MGEEKTPPPAQSYSGQLRAKVTILAIDRCRIEWIKGDNPSLVVWTEDIAITPGMSAVSQIAGEGEFEPRPGFFVDGAGKRHFVVQLEPGKIGVIGKPLTGT